jgi:hypothetical protein
MSSGQPGTITTQTVQVPRPPLSKFEREEQAFHRLLPDLLRAHAGQYVAIHDERVIDSDSDEAALAFRVLARLGNVDLYIGRVTTTPAVARIPR